MSEEVLTPWDLPHSPFTDTERIRANLNHHSSVENEKDHLHLARVLLPFLPVWRQINHARAEERQSERFRVAERAVMNFSCLNGRVRVRKLRYCRSARRDSEMDRMLNARTVFSFFRVRSLRRIPDCNQSSHYALLRLPRLLLFILFF